MLTDRADGFETFSLAWVAQSTDLAPPEIRAVTD